MLLSIQVYVNDIATGLYEQVLCLSIRVEIVYLFTICLNIEHSLNYTLHITH